MSAPPPAAAEAISPVGAEEFARLVEGLGGFEPGPFVACAVSGGPDSVALAWLLQGWARARGGRALALHFDHGLRPESAAEAERVEAWLGSLGLDCRVLRWEGPKPVSRVQERAREARHAALEAACARAGCLHLLLAHHADDQAETVAMRRARGSGPVGLAGMCAVSYREQVRLLRPLLTVPKARLLGTVATAGLPYLDDPSNLDPRFWRGRHRLARARDGAAPDAPAVSAPAPAALERRRLERALALWLAEHASVHPLGWVEVPLEALRGAEVDLRGLFLARALTCFGAQTHPPGRTSVAALASWITGATAPSGRTLGGCEVKVRQGRLVVARESGRIRDRLRLDEGERALWDDRFEVHARTKVWVVPAKRPGRSRLEVERVAASVRARSAGFGWSSAAWEALPLVMEAESGCPCQIGPWPLRASVPGDGTGASRAAEIEFRPSRRLSELWR